jgi:ABC-type branched-subunit amino acid transport system ATPase component
MPEFLLVVETISKHFGGLLAIDNTSFHVETGTITALIGPNGAGKTTLFSIISGFLPADGGRVLYDGADITAAPPHQRARRGIARTFQIVQPFAGLTVRENIAIGSHLWQRSRAAALEAANQVALAVGLGAQLEAPAATLTVASSKRLELARALAIAPRLLLLDEVLAGLNPSEIRDMVPVIRQLTARGMTILMTEHVMQAVTALAEYVLVLAQGRIIARGTAQQVAVDPVVVEAYLGAGAAARMAAGSAHA